MYVCIYIYIYILYLQFEQSALGAVRELSGGRFPVLLTLVRDHTNPPHPHKSDLNQLNKFKLQ